MVRWGSGGCEPRIEVIVKLKKVWEIVGGGGGGVGGGSDGCEPRIEFIVKLKKMGLGVGWMCSKN